MMKRVLVFGSRDWPAKTMIRRDMWQLYQSIGLYRLVNGFCPNSPDMWADEFALEMGWPHPERHPADWNKYGRAAGPIRNQEMADTYPDYAMGYILNSSKGSCDMEDALDRTRTITRITSMKVFDDLGFPELT
jgi:hypothetical protein